MPHWPIPFGPLTSTATPARACCPWAARRATLAPRRRCRSRRPRRCRLSRSLPGPPAPTAASAASPTPSAPSRSQVSAAGSAARSRHWPWRTTSTRYSPPPHPCWNREPSVTTDASSTDGNVPRVRSQGRGPIVTPAVLTDVSYADMAACSRAPLAAPRAVFPVHAVDGSQYGR
jgi:hypothetical protein